MYHFYRKKAEIEVFGLPLSEDSRKREWKTGAYARKLKRILNFELTVYYVVKIQFLVRRFLRRLKMKAHKAREREKDRAALLLQRIARGFLARILCNKMRVTHGLDPLNFQELFERRKREKEQLILQGHVRRETERLWKLFHVANDGILRAYRLDVRKQHLEQLKLLVTAIEDGKIGDFAFYDVAKDARIPAKALKRWVNDDLIVKKPRDMESKEDFMWRNERTMSLLEEQVLVWAGSNERVREIIGLWRIEVFAPKEPAPEVAKKAHSLSHVIPDYYEMRSLREIMASAQRLLGLRSHPDVSSFPHASARAEDEGAERVLAELNEANDGLEHKDLGLPALMESDSLEAMPQMLTSLEQKEQQQQQQAEFDTASSACPTSEGPELTPHPPPADDPRADTELPSFISRVRASLYHRNIDMKTMLLALDKDKDGYLSLHEFDKAMRILNIRMNPRDLHDITRAFVEENTPTQLSLRCLLGWFTADLIRSESIDDKVSLFVSAVKADFDLFATSDNELELEQIRRGCVLLEQFNDLLLINPPKDGQHVQLLGLCVLKNVVHMFELELHDKDTLVRFVRILLYLSEQRWKCLVLELYTWYMPIESEFHLRMQMTAMKKNKDKKQHAVLSHRVSCYMPVQVMGKHSARSFCDVAAGDACTRFCTVFNVQDRNEDGRKGANRCRDGSCQLQLISLFCGTDKGNVIFEVFIDACRHLTSLCHIEKEIRKRDHDSIKDNKGKLPPPSPPPPPPPPPAPPHIHIPLLIKSSNPSS
eukprot:762950-Hanusia_phi.AAC.4